MATENKINHIQVYILQLVENQFMYSDEIIRHTIDKFNNQIDSKNINLTLKNYVKFLADDKYIAYYHGYKITPKGKALLSKI